MTVRSRPSVVSHNRPMLFAKCLLVVLEIPGLASQSSCNHQQWFYRICFFFARLFSPVLLFASSRLVPLPNGWKATGEQDFECLPVAAAFASDWLVWNDFFFIYFLLNSLVLLIQWCFLADDSINSNFNLHMNVFGSLRLNGSQWASRNDSLECQNKRRTTKRCGRDKK